MAIRKLKKIKSQHLVEEWLRKFSDYLRDENTPFTSKEAKEMGKYKAGDVIYADFGYNIGSEHGGNHYAVVIEDNEMSASMIMVVPLSSLPPDKTEADVYRLEVYLGEIPELNKISHAPEGTQSVAVMNQMRAISKKRIINPRKKEQGRIVFLEGEVLQKIYNAIIERHTKYGLKRTHKVNKPSKPVKK
jgi:mRNA interferase MazF